MDIRYFVFTDENCPESIPSNRFWQVYDRRTPLPGQAGRRVRFASVVVLWEGGRAVGIGPLAAVRFGFDRKGFIRVGETRKYALCTALTASLSDLARVTADPDLLDTHRLFQKRGSNPFEWQPTPEEVAAIENLALAGEE